MKQYERYIKAEEDRKQGKYNGAPWYKLFPWLGEYIPTLSKGDQIMLLAGSGTGKSQLFIGMILMPVYKLIKEIGYKARFYIFLLEDSLELFEDRLFARVLVEVTGKYVDTLQLQAKRKEFVPEEVKKQYPRVQEIVDDILSYCTIVDNIFHPTGIYKFLRTESDKLGEHFWVDRHIKYKSESGATIEKDTKSYSYYKPNDEDEHVIVSIDNLNNLSAEAGGSTWESISRWTRDYVRLQISKYWKWTIFNIMQTSLETDRQQFTMFNGRQIIEKLEPSTAALGDNRVCARDHFLILGMFAPARFGISDYGGYNISRLRDHYRSLIILKANFSTSNIKVSMYFHGASCFYKELPKPEDMKEEMYVAVENDMVKPEIKVK